MLRKDRLMWGFLATSHIAASAFIRIHGFIDPGEFSADLIDRGIRARHSPIKSKWNRVGACWLGLMDGPGFESGADAPG